MNLKSIHEIDQRLADLEREREKLLQLKDHLQGQVQTNEPHLTVKEKIDLFQSIFRGRTDIFATKWQNKQGRKGYAVACDNQWVQGICEKPRIQCKDCSHRRFSTLTNQVIFNHLSGKDIVGVYPMLPDNSCCFLAADFDKKNWKLEVQAMSSACDQLQIPHLIEISQSGNGAHLWIIFASNVPAASARRLGFSLLDKAMESYPSLSFESYDRLFPNQDVMPEGGFGNLIALPLQKQARRYGFSSFVDKEFNVISDQWRHLKNVKRLSLQRLEGVLSQVSPAVQFSLEQQEIKDKPWEITLQSAPLVIDNPPSKITITLVNYLYFELEGLPSQLIARLRRIATFSNPVFYKTQALRFSTHSIPRFISCAQFEQGYLALPRGCLDDVMSLFKDLSIDVAFDDKRTIGTALPEMDLTIEFRQEQKVAIEELNKFDTGILHAPTAFGKTVTAIGMINKRKCNTLILVHSRQLLDQWKERLQHFMPDVEVGVFGAGKKRATKIVDVATYQSLVEGSSGHVNTIVHDYGHVIIDECHHLSAPKYELVLNEVRAKYVLGLTATPERQDGHQKITFMSAGPIRYKAKTTSSKFIQNVIAYRRYDSVPKDFISGEPRPQISDIYQWLSDNDDRNKSIIQKVIESVADGGNPILLTERRSHAEQLSEMLEKEKINVVTLRGGMGVKQRNHLNKQLPSAQVIVATGKYIGEGFDLPKLDTLFLTMPIAWKGSLAQYAGRIQRQAQNKTEITIHDFIDCNIPMLDRMFKKRERSYTALGYSIEFSGTQSGII